MKVAVTLAPHACRAALLDAASRPYRRAGPGLFAYFFARGKLRADPVYRAIIERGLLRDSSRILDLGCGQALLAAWLNAAVQLYDSARWPDGWPAPPRPRSIRGIELMRRDVVRAHRALGAGADVVRGDIRRAEFGSVDTVVALDVLHYVDWAAQRDVLARARGALPTGGLLLLRVADTGAGLRHRYGRWVDRIVMFLRGHAWMNPHCRNIVEWQRLLSDSGFRSDALPMSEGTPFANVLLIGRAT